MELKDKRLLNLVDTENQNKYLEGVNSSVPDADKKYEEIEVIHEPINLLHKIKTRQAEKSASVYDPSEQTDENE